MSHPIVLGTAGHIDHGKTSLVRALTGIDTDRLKEEKERGITIELGFAPLDLVWKGKPVRCGVVDVPGHERFVKTMVAGASGIDVALLVVAADEGVMPQTREHLDICRLLGVGAAVVALCKADLADAEMAALAAEDARAALVEAGGPFAEAPIVPCSAMTGAGLDALRAALAEAAAAAAPRAAEGIARLPVDRVFSLKGHGTIVTGTLAGGRVAPGDELEVLPGGARGKVRSVQVHGADVAEARAGMRTALNVQGLDREEIGRGWVLAEPGALRVSRLADVTVRVVGGAARGLRHRDRVLLHAGTAQVPATAALFDGKEIAAGAEGPVRLVLDAPGAVLAGGDRFILRATGPVTGYGRTLGGGVVLDPAPPRRKRRDAAVLALLETLGRAPLEERIVALAEEGAAGGGAKAGASGAGGAGNGAAEAGVDAAALLRRTGATRPALEKALGKLASAGALVRYDKERDAYVGGAALGALAARARALLEEFHRAHPMRGGMAREELRGRLGAPDPRLFHALLGRMADVEADAQVVRLRGFQAKGTSSVVEDVRRALGGAGLEPPRVEELVPAAPRTEVKEALAFLAQSGEVVRTRDGLFFARAPVDGLRDRLVAFLRDKTEITAQEFKAMVGASRKFAIPLAEHFDAEKVTIRVGEKRVLRKA